MKCLLEIVDCDQIIKRIDIGPPAYSKDFTTFRVNVTELSPATQPTGRRRRRTRPVREAIERFADPNREHPVLKKLLSTVAPIAISFLTQQLPSWLGDLDLDGPGPDAHPDK